MGKILGLRGLIYKKFDSQSTFAAHLGWSRQRLSAITCGKRIPSIYEAYDIAQGLEVSLDKIAHVFITGGGRNEE